MARTDVTVRLDGGVTELLERSRLPIEARLGVLPGAGGTQRLPRLIPRGVATEMLMLGRTIDGVRAYQLGLVNQLAASGDAALTDAVALAGELFATPDGQEGFAAFRERRAPAFAAGQPS